MLAVSGGPDSVALMQLAAAWRGCATMPVAIATVDHGLRRGSADVAAGVVEAATALGLPAHVLTWEGDKPRNAVQASAREARYRLLQRFAGGVGASHLVTAHTRDDQAETVLMRLAAGSGLSGLAGMRPSTPLGALILARPLLGIAKQTLVELCRNNRWAFHDDPANGDPRFARTRWRALAPALEAEGLTTRRLARLAERAARADAALDRIAIDTAARCRVGDEAGRLCFAAPALLAEPDEIVLRVLARALTAVGGGERLRLQRLERLLAALRQGAEARSSVRRTLSGCLVECGPATLVLSREPARRAGLRGPREPARFQSR